MAVATRVKLASFSLTRRHLIIRLHDLNWFGETDLNRAISRSLMRARATPRAPVQLKTLYHNRTLTCCTLLCNFYLLYEMVQAERFERPMSSERILIYSQVQPTVSDLACKMEERVGFQPTYAGITDIYWFSRPAP